MIEPWVTVERVMEHLSYRHPDSVYRCVRDGMPAHRLRGQLRFRLSEVDKWLTGGEGSVVSLTERRTA